MSLIQKTEQVSLIQKTKQVPAVAAYDKVVVIGVKCELCPRIGRDEAGEGGGDYSKDRFEHMETRVSLQKGSHDPDGGGFINTLALDICPDCFTKKLVPWFKVQGGQARESELVY